MFYCDDSPHVAEQLKKNVEPLWMWRLPEELELTKENGAKLSAVIRKYEDKKKEAAGKKEDGLSETEEHDRERRDTCGADQKSNKGPGRK